MENQQGTIFGQTEGKIIVGDLPYLQEVAQTGEDRLGELDGLLKLFYLDPVKRTARESWYFDFRIDLENPPAILISISRAGGKGGWENRLDFFPDHVQRWLNQTFNLYLQADYAGSAVTDNAGSLERILDLCHQDGRKVTLMQEAHPTPTVPGQTRLFSLRTKGICCRPENPEIVQRRTKQAARKLLKQLGVKPQRAPRQRP